MPSLIPVLAELAIAKMAPSRRGRCSPLLSLRLALRTAALEAPPVDLAGGVRIAEFAKSSRMGCSRRFTPFNEADLLLDTAEFTEIAGP